MTFVWFVKLCPTKTARSASEEDILVWLSHSEPFHKFIERIRTGDNGCSYVRTIGVKSFLVSTAASCVREQVSYRLGKNNPQFFPALTKKHISPMWVMRCSAVLSICWSFVEEFIKL